MNDLITPILFERIVIVPTPFDDDIQKCKELQEDLILGKQIPQSHARRAVIEFIDFIYSHDEWTPWIEMLGYLMPKLYKLQSLRCVNCTIPTNEECFDGTHAQLDVLPVQIFYSLIDLALHPGCRINQNNSRSCN
jgi:hypothetical protein